MFISNITESNQQQRLFAPLFYCCCYLVAWMVPLCEDDVDTTDVSWYAQAEIRRCFLWLAQVYVPSSWHCNGSPISDHTVRNSTGDILNVSTSQTHRHMESKRKRIKLNRHFINIRLDVCELILRYKLSFFTNIVIYPQAPRVLSCNSRSTHFLVTVYAVGYG